MARIAALAMLLTSLTASQAYAESIDDVAAEAGVDAVRLQEALDVQQLTDPRSYLTAVGELVAPAYSSRVACIVAHESQWNPNAVNPRSGASGYGQFLRSTWMTTPQGRAGYSVFNPAANLAAVQWMIDVGRAREFEVVGVFGC